MKEFIYDICEGFIEIAMLFILIPIGIGEMVFRYLFCDDN